MNLAHFRLYRYVPAYFRQTLEMLIAAHHHAFTYFGGVPSVFMITLKTIVKQIKQGKERSFNERFLAMMKHFLIEPTCIPFSGREKGQGKFKERKKRSPFSLYLGYRTTRLDGEYIKAKRNIILVGVPGTGKTHLAIALSSQATEPGYKVRFWNLLD